MCSQPYCLTRSFDVHWYNFQRFCREDPSWCLFLYFFWLWLQIAIEPFCVIYYVIFQWRDRGPLRRLTIYSNILLLRPLLGPAKSAHVYARGRKQCFKLHYWLWRVSVKPIFISCNENIQIFTRASHSWKYWCFHYTLWQYLWYSEQKSKYPLFSCTPGMDNPGFYPGIEILILLRLSYRG